MLKKGICHTILLGGVKLEKRNIVSVNFREKDRELFEFVIKKGSIIGNSNYIKQLIYEEMQREKASKKN